MNRSFFYQHKSKNLKLLTVLHYSLRGEPFLIEEIVLNENVIKIEFYYLDQSKYYSALFDSRQFAIWTADKGVYRLLIEKNYYKKFKPLYQKKLNIIWIDFIIQVYQKEIKYINKIKLVFLAGVLPILLIIIKLLLQQDYSMDWKFIFPLIILILLFFVINYWIKNKNKKLLEFKSYKHQKTLEQFQHILGVDFFKELLEKQISYNPDYIATEPSK